MINHKSASSGKVFRGIIASKGLAIGRAQILYHDAIHLSESGIEENQAEAQWQSVQQACKTVKSEIMLTRSIAQQQTQPEIDQILESQLQILDDPDLLSRIKEAIFSNLKAADSAIWLSFKRFIDIFERTRNEVILQRIPDVKEVRDRLVRCVQQRTFKNDIQHAAILVSDRLSPAEVLTAHQNGARAIVCDRGGLTSHSAIIAHALNMPMLIGLRTITRHVNEEDLLIVDALHGFVIVHPDTELIEEYHTKIDAEKAVLKKELEILEKPSVFRDGAVFTLRANIDFIQEIENVTTYRCEGVGLLRTESLLLDNGNTISVEGQVQFFTNILNQISTDLTIRLFDIGGDKFTAHKNPESNPFLGERGIRFLLANKDLLRGQLKAILQTAKKFPGRVKILVPMLSVIEEWKEFKAEFDSLKNEIQAPEIPLGAMVEVPSFIVQAEQFARYVDFFSIGTNDLTQYIMAADRGNPLITSLYNPLQPAVFKGIYWMAKAARLHQKPLSVCGEAASNPFIAVAFAGLGITELSMTPHAVPVVKKALTSVNLAEAQKIAEQILACDTVEEVQQIADNFLGNLN